MRNKNLMSNASLQLPMLKRPSTTMIDTRAIILVAAGPNTASPQLMVRSS